MEYNEHIITGLERRLLNRGAPVIESAMQSRIVEAVSAEIARPKRRVASIPASWVAVAVAMFAAMLQFAGSAAAFHGDELPARGAVVVTPDMIEPLSNDPAERQAMAESLAFCGSPPIRLLPQLHSSFANFSGAGAGTLLQETP